MNVLRAIWAWMNSLGAPAMPAGAAFTPLVPAGEAREPANDQDGVRYRAEIKHRRELMDLLCVQANAYVYRDYGQGVQVLADTPATPIDEGTRLEIEKIATADQ